MFDTLPKSAQEFAAWGWPQIAPYYDDLAERDLTANTIEGWLTDWTKVENLIDEARSRLYVASTVDTTDEAGVARYLAYLTEIIEPVQSAAQRLKEKLLMSELEVEGFAIPLRNMQAEAALFREANVPLFTEEDRLNTEYDKIIGAQTVMWEGEERTLTQMKPVFQSDDRALREKAWHLMSERQLADRPILNGMWGKYMGLRKQIAQNAGFSDYRAWRWQDFKRFDYTAADCETFHEAIERVGVPAATRAYERQRARLGVETLRPWDLDRDDVYPPSRPPLHPFQTSEELIAKAEVIFQQVDPELGEYFSIMRRENLLDLDNRKGKAPGGYQIDLRLVKRPFIFMNAVGIHDDVQTLLHEGGHAFHSFESSRLPYAQQKDFSSEIAEVASMSMELLAAPYLTQAKGGYYSEADAARARIEHLEGMLMFWPYMAVVDAFQHWVYTHDEVAVDPAACDDKWSELWNRFIPGVDWSGLDDARATGWHRKLHIFQDPFYYVDYGLAQMGAVQVWRNSLSDQAGAVQRYREALSLGGTRALPELFAAAGAKFAFDAQTLGEVVGLIEETIEDLSR